MEETYSSITTPALQFPLISIGLPTYNSYGKILKALQSIWDQKYPNLEVIISDNCSTDNTKELFTTIIHDHPQTIYFRQTANIGLVQNFEFVLRQSKGEYFMWIADDDKLEPDILKKYVEFLMSHPEYSLVSGQIKYWRGDKAIFLENNFSMEDKHRDMRVLHYYYKVMYGAVFHGLMHRCAAEKIPLLNSIGNDFHFVASLAYAGKIKQFNYVGYHKQLNGASKNSANYAKAIGASWFSASFPRISIARDAFHEILFKSPVYKKRNIPARFILATVCFAGVLISYYGVKFPFIVAGHLKRNISKPFNAKFKIKKI